MIRLDLPVAQRPYSSTGLDARGRKQYRYHPKWRELRDQNKYEHMMQFAAELPALRARVVSDMKLDGLPREKVLATIVSLLEKTLIRVGNAEYAAQNKSYGLTTMRRKHVAMDGASWVRLYRQVRQAMEAADRGQAHRRHRQALRGNPGTRALQIPRRQRQFAHDRFGDVNAYIREITGEDFSAKDFRTWAGTVLAALALAEFKKSTARRRPSATWSPPSRRWPSNSATRRPSAARATYIPKY